jgi:hypothetical protein
MKNIFKPLDDFFDYVFGEGSNTLLFRFSRYCISALAVGVLGACTAYFVTHGGVDGAVVRSQVRLLGKALQKAHNDVRFMQILPGKHSLDFLVASRFECDSNAGIGVERKNAWKGPYLNRIPTIQGHPYVLLKTSKGLFVVPGDGVELPSGIVIGNGISWSDKMDIKALMSDGNMLTIGKYPLAAEVTLN